MTTGLLDWLADPPADRGLRRYDRDGGWTFHPYSELAGQALGMAGRLREDGVGRGDVVAIALGSGPEFVGGYFGALAAGAVPMPVARPMPLQDGAAYRRRLGRVFRSVPTKRVVTRPEWRAVLAGVGPSLITDAPTACAGRAGDPAEHALVQFTSGSSGEPKPVAITASALRANIEAIRRWLGMGPADVTATWLPFHHDMGLVGTLLTPVVSRTDLWVIRPEDFVRSPVEWLRCFGVHGAGLSAAPTFGLGHVARRVSAEDLDGMDFGGWRSLITGAERIDPRVLDAFTELLEPHGFSARTLTPAYGLAEATLAVTGTAVDEEPRVVWADRRTLTPGGRVVVDRGDTVPVVGCGAPLAAAGSVWVADQLGDPVPDGVVGEIVVGQLRTGDSGFLREGQLYVLGRMGDSLKRRARTVFAEDVELGLSAVDGLLPVRPVVLLGALGGVDTAVVVAETRPGPWADEAARVVRGHVEGIDVLVVAGHRGIVRRTSSGKPCRRAMWDAFVAGELGRPLDVRPAPARPEPAEILCSTRKGGDMSERCRVVVNAQRQYSVWPVERELPAGWTAEGTVGTEQECLAHIEQVWTDIRPLSLRLRTEVAP
ncbi:AMP-binding protein [Kutzneria sp. NPDC052558]|uniref:AMP-binding protein n=1 Tax=Kutzneria sp. NPDC052558 TaxID=3364121 RepID=UPI0037C9C62E